MIAVFDVLNIVKYLTLELGVPWHKIMRLMPYVLPVH